MQKYSSNVVEKCLERSDEQVVSKFIEEISQHTRVIDLMKNSYGNYVVQKALKISTGQSKAKFVNIIMKHLDKLGDKKLISKWKAIVNNSMHLNLGLNNNNMALNLSGLSSHSERSNKSENVSSPQKQKILPNNFMHSPQNNNSRTMSRSLHSSPIQQQYFINNNYQHPQQQININNYKH